MGFLKKKRDDDAAGSVATTALTVSSVSSSSDTEEENHEQHWSQDGREGKQKSLKRKLVGSRRQRAELIRSPQQYASFVEATKAVEAACHTFVEEHKLFLQKGMFELLFGNNECIPSCGAWNFWPEQEEDTSQFEGSTILREAIAVAVEVTAMCERDLLAREHDDESSSELYPQNDVGGSSFVGIVHDCDLGAQEFDIQHGSRVASVGTWRSNSKYVSIPKERLLVVPKHLDAAEVASVVSSYLPAFEALHHGRLRPYRYSRTCLRGRNVLITGGATIECQALIRLSKLAGAKYVFVAAPREHHNTIRKKKALPLLEDPTDWLPEVQRIMDVVIDYTFPHNLSAVQEAMTDKGRLICVEKEDSLISIFERYMLSTIKRATLLDFLEYFDNYRDDVRQDLEFLLKLLETRQIRPEIDRFVGFRDVPVVPKSRASKPLSGTVICEPWRE